MGTCNELLCIFCINYKGTLYYAESSKKNPEAQHRMVYETNPSYCGKIHGEVRKKLSHMYCTAKRDSTAI